MKGYTCKSLIFENEIGQFNSIPIKLFLNLICYRGTHNYVIDKVAVSFAKIVAMFVKCKSRVHVY